MEVLFKILKPLRSSKLPARPPPLCKNIHVLWVFRSPCGIRLGNWSCYGVKLVNSRITYFVEDTILTIYRHTSTFDSKICYIPYDKLVMTNKDGPCLLARLSNDHGTRKELYISHLHLHLRYTSRYKDVLMIVDNNNYFVNILTRWCLFHSWTFYNAARRVLSVLRELYHKLGEESEWAFVRIIPVKQ